MANFYQGDTVALPFTVIDPATKLPVDLTAGQVQAVLVTSKGQCLPVQTVPTTVPAPLPKVYTTAPGAGEGLLALSATWDCSGYIQVEGADSALFPEGTILADIMHTLASTVFSPPAAETRTYRVALGFVQRKCDPAV